MINTIFVKTILPVLFTLTFFLTAQAHAAGNSGDATLGNPASADAQPAVIKSMDSTTVTNAGVNRAVLKPTSQDITIAPGSRDLTPAGVTAPPQFTPSPEGRSQAAAIARMSSIDIRKTKIINWPPVDLLKDQANKYKDLPNLKDVKKLRERLYEKCKDYVKAYSDHIRKELNDVSIGLQFEFQCDLYSLSIEDVPDPLSDQIYAIPSDFLLKRLDAITVSLYLTNSSRAATTAAANNLSAKVLYDSTLFALMGMPQTVALWLMQVLLIITTLISIYLLYSKFRD
ncbi:hypothetical protein K2P97_01165 [bacterium]|nr:hypothetical protein [bacterium]